MLEVILSNENEQSLTKARQWEEEVFMDDIDYGVMKLVPLFLQKLKEINFTTRHEKRLKVLYKYWWLKTLKNLDLVREVLLAFSTHEKSVMLIKGVPVLKYYEKAVERPMADLDILVKKEDVLDIIHIFADLGWKCTNSLFQKNLQKKPGLCLDFKHSIEFEHEGDGVKMDLHWKVGNYASWELTEQVWAKATDSQDYPKTKIPELSHLLCMSILHSVDSESKNHYNWIIDVDKLGAELTQEIWEKAREMAKSEHKEDWFDYGCFLLNQFGVKTPFVSQTKNTAPVGRLTKQEFGSKLNFLRYLWKKTENNLTILSINFPHDRGLVKIYRMSRRLAYFRLNRIT